MNHYQDLMVGLPTVIGLLAAAVALAFINPWALLGYGISLVALDEAVDWYTLRRQKKGDS